MAKSGHSSLLLPLLLSLGVVSAFQSGTTFLASSSSACPKTTAIHMSAKALEGKRVLVTGGGRGIGKAIALLCAEEGAKVAILARTDAELNQVAAESETRFESPMLVLTADVTKEEEVETAISKAVKEMGGIDLLVNNAGGSSAKGPLHEQPIADFRKLLDLNVISVLIVSQAVLRQSMLAANAGKVGLPSVLPYVATKFAVEGSTATMAAELKAQLAAAFGGQLSRSTLTWGAVVPGDPRQFALPRDGRHEELSESAWPARSAVLTRRDNALLLAGVRTAESIRDGFLHLCSSDVSGCYLHVDEFDTAVAAGKPELACKPINEPEFRV